MEVVIKTKFNIGDAVYIPDFYGGYFANPNPYIITDVFVKVSRTRNIIIQYRVTQDELTDVVSENFIFATNEECVQWCEGNR